ncbi:MAG: zf-HC2 domain-containing protein, partial [Candidatus Latescibacteria bacterium]|nr:zf-HC2 domain-containing protein [Candidatus Latescibacterota bacterium]
MAENDKICNQFDHVLWAFMDGDMSERHRIFWETHTKECERCQTL